MIHVWRGINNPLVVLLIPGGVGSLSLLISTQEELVPRTIIPWTKEFASLQSAGLAMPIGACAAILGSARLVLTLCRIKCINVF